jgi:hypothetical protein
LKLFGSTALQPFQSFQSRDSASCIYSEPLRVSRASFVISIWLIKNFSLTSKIIVPRELAAFIIIFSKSVKSAQED